MDLNLVEQRRHAHLLIDALPENKLSAVNSHDEELPPESIAILERANSAIGRGETISHEEVLREFGL